MPRLRSLPEQPAMRDVYRAYQETCRPLCVVTEAAMRGPSPLTQGQRELIAAYVSWLNACTYCHSTQLGVAEACGVAPDLITASLADVETAPLESRMKPILRYARRLTPTLRA
jgi:alkylhydroperoxidase family enzyme